MTFIRAFVLNKSKQNSSKNPEGHNLWYTFVQQYFPPRNCALFFSSLHRSVGVSYYGRKL